MPRILTRQPIVQEKVKFNLNVEFLNSVIKYTQCESIAKSDLYKLKKLLDYTDSSLYQVEVAIAMRLDTLKHIVDIMLNDITSIDLIRSKLGETFSIGLEILEDVGFEKNLLNLSECNYVRNMINIRLQYIEIYQKKDKLINLLTEIDKNFKCDTSYYDMIQTLKSTMGELLVALQESDNGQGLVKEFSFSDAEAANLLNSIITKAKKPTSILQTGIRQLNAILSPGFHSGRLYTIIGGSGKFKSGTLLNIADQIRLFNPQVIPKENGLRKCILFITLENSIEETLERLYDMYSDLDSDLRDSDPEEIINTLKHDGGFSIGKDGDNIDMLFRYAGNLEISTSDIYTYVNDARNKGLDPIAIVVDYIKRIDSAHPSNGDERVRMSFVAKELKSIAQHFQVPVITAMQLNREGNSIIDTAIRDCKQDVARFVGSSSIGNAWDIVEDSDWVCLINLELQKSTNRLFLTFKRLKIRGKKIPMASDYFNHPFTNVKNIRLEPDVNKDGPISVVSLTNDLESIDEGLDPIFTENNNNNGKIVNLQEMNRQKKDSQSIISSLKGCHPSSLFA